MDKALRNALRAAVVACRQVLEEDVRGQLEGRYGVTPKGEFLVAEEFAPYGDETVPAARASILDAICHIESYGIPRKDAVGQFVRETAFTHLNRLAALKLMEHESRGLILESVGQGKESKGFLLFQKVSPEACRAAKNSDVLDSGYRLYLECLYDDLATELGVLFDRRLPQSIIFPSDACLKKIVDILNGGEIAGVWGEDETIGWIYQYFTPKELRDKARKESSAPRNSYELAFRNQFYTPRYVVQFLVDNTLGRIWYEMHQGNTRLKDECRYLVYQPNEIFPDDNQQPRQDDEPDGPIYVPYRAKKDPRDLKLLDPASGSAHFLLYSFDVLETTYEESWADEHAPVSALTGNTLRQDYPDLDSLRRAVPTLVLQHNLHGIDIDLRATQIAALALWLRAQRSFQRLGFKVAERPRIARSDIRIVCAEPMPGERELLEEFTAGLEPKVLGELVRRAFDSMTLAGEAGSLLKIEEELRDDIARAKQQWLKRPKREQLALFPEPERRKAEQMPLFDLSGITNEKFWDDADERVVAELHRYASGAANGKSFLRRLFADDAERGFAFIDVCRQRFDVVLMNPPFGEASKPSKAYIEQTYPWTKNDVYAAFVERGVGWLHTGGMLGAITSRTGFFLSSFQKWREEILLKEVRPTVVADLGQGVLDSAMVETAAYCLAKDAFLPGAH